MEESKKGEIYVLVHNCNAVLQQLSKLVAKYKSLGTNRKRTWDSVRFRSENLQDMREKLMMHTSSLTLFLATLGTSSLGRIEKKLDELIADVRAERRENTVLSIVDANEAESEEEWNKFKAELVEECFAKLEVEAHKQELLDGGGSLGQHFGEKGGSAGGQIDATQQRKPIVDGSFTPEHPTGTSNVPLDGSSSGPLPTTTFSPDGSSSQVATNELKSETSTPKIPPIPDPSKGFLHFQRPLSAHGVLVNPDKQRKPQSPSSFHLRTWMRKNDKEEEIPLRSIGRVTDVALASTGSLAAYLVGSFIHIFDIRLEETSATARSPLPLPSGKGWKSIAVAGSYLVAWGHSSTSGKKLVRT